MSEAPTPSTEAAPEPVAVVAPAPLPGDGSLLSEAAPAPAESEAVSTEETKNPLEETKPAGAPEAYSDFTIPESLTIDQPLMSKFQEWGKTQNLSQEAAQGALDLYAETVQTQVETAAKQFAEQAQTSWKDINTQWLKELDAVPDFQGDNKKASLQVISKALEEYGVGDVRSAFALTGAGNNPAVVQTFLKMARALSEGNFISGGKPATGPQTSGQILYGDSPQK